VVPLFRRGGTLDGVPEAVMPLLPPEPAPLADLSGEPSINLADKAKLWMVLGSGGTGKTVYNLWLIGRMLERGGSSVLAALDPGPRMLTTWFDNVEEPPTRDTASTSRWLHDLLDYLVTAKTGAVLDFGGGGEAALELVVRSSHPDLHTHLDEAGIWLVAAFTIGPREQDLFILQGLDDAGFRPTARLLLLNEGTKHDPARTREDEFAGVLRHSIFKRAIATGAVPIWIPGLESDVWSEIAAKRLHFMMARDGRVPAGATFPPLGGWRRTMVSRWLARMETAHTAVAAAGWLP
jgi:hypothetical protein